MAMGLPPVMLPASNLWAQKSGPRVSPRTAMSDSETLTEHVAPVHALSHLAVLRVDVQVLLNRLAHDLPEVVREVATGHFQSHPVRLDRAAHRSEEHTSELQSRENL